MDASQTEFLNLACIKALNRKSQSTGENVNELRNPQLSEETTLEGLGKAVILGMLSSFFKWTFQ